MSSAAIDFVVARNNLRHSKLVTTPLARELPPGQALLKVDVFAFTANNVSYAVIGEMLSYWNFFPAEPGCGRVPVWGFADVLHSTHAEITEGQRYFGYLPMSTHLLVQPDRVTRTGFVDGVAHRTSLPPVYNLYRLTTADSGYAPEHEDLHMLFRPLFMTSFLLDDFISDSGFFGARTVVLSSASSKTSIGLAFLLHHNRRERCEVVGLTSPGNLQFVEGLGCYDRVVTYDRINSLRPDTPVVFVDMAGNTAVLSAVHRHFGDHIRQSTLVGLTHWEERGAAAELPGATPTFFFAPTRVQKRTGDWGAAGLESRYAAAWREFRAFVTPQIRVVHGRGAAAVEAVYREMLEGQSSPDEGHVLSLWA